MQLTADFYQQTAKVLTVSELTRNIRGALETKFAAVWVQGEISNYKLHPSGHQYFTLKDQRAQIACVIFRNAMLPLRQPLADGTQVQVYGNVSVFEARGQYQINVQILQPRGLGLLQAKFEALKRKLDAEGLFDPARKKSLPKFPRRIGIVTSTSGAAIRDMLNVLRRRAPWLDILINPVRVQGTGAAAEIAVAIRELSEPNPNWEYVDLVVVARGGGSIEDLWEFNEEIVARAIAASPIPIVSAIGHEIDFTIADFVADLRAPTPSAAAELIVPDIVDLTRRIDELAACLLKCLRNFLAHERTRLRFLSERTLARELIKRLHDAQQRIDLTRESLDRHIVRKIDNSRVALTDLHRRFVSLPSRLYESAQQRFRRVDGLLRVLGPDATLRRGYSITTDERGKVIKSVRAVRAKMKIRTRVSDGEFGSTVEK
ncbi:MAG: exodeoxyribonuclease large subunit [Verrucomicrobiota bacterium]|jgi:exodeoxyribonuclease VII large subunit